MSDGITCATTGYKDKNGVVHIIDVRHYKNGEEVANNGQ